MRISDWSSDVCSFDLDFQRQFGAVDLEGVVNGGNRVTREFHVDDGADDLHNLASAHLMTFSLSTFSRCVCGVEDFKSFRRQLRRRRFPPVPWWCWPDAPCCTAAAAR